MSDELVFTVDGSKAVPAKSISLAEAGLLERYHLQEWVLAHPEMLGPGVMVVTFEFDRWQSHGGAAEKDRLDILGLDREGRLVIAELKRDLAPDTVTMQSLKYAAMASRFTSADLGQQHAKFLSKSQKAEPPDADEALNLLNAHCDFSMSEESLRRPRIVLLASSYPPPVTATVVWLTEMGLDITLMRLQAYRTESEMLVTVSQLFPVKDVEEFVIGPKPPDQIKNPFSFVTWTQDDIDDLRKTVVNPTVIAALDLCAKSPGIPISLSSIVESAGVTHSQAKGGLASLTVMVKQRFKRSNWPFTAQWGSGDDQQAYYFMTPEVAQLWHAAAVSLPGNEPQVPPADVNNTNTPANGS